MNTEIEVTIDKILSIASDFNNLGNVSWNTLLTQSGYFEHYKEINEEKLVSALEKTPDLINEWLRLSDDSRSSEKWMLWIGESGRYHVSHWPEGAEFPEFHPETKFEACAHFIVKKIEWSRIDLTS